MPTAPSKDKTRLNIRVAAAPRPRRLPIRRHRGTIAAMLSFRVIYLVSMAILMILAGVAMGPGEALSKRRCAPPDDVPSVSFVVKPGIVKTHDGFSQAQIHRRAKAHSRSSSRVVGLTSTTLIDKLQVGIVAVPVRSRQYCGYLKSIEFSLGYDTMTIYVAREFRRNRCKFQSVMAHENRHVSIFRENLADFQSRFESLLERIAATAKPITVRSENEAARRFLKGIQRRIQPLMSKMIRARDRAHDRIDTPENYRREQDLCDP